MLKNINAYEVQSILSDNVSRRLDKESDLFLNIDDKISLTESITTGWELSQGVIGVYELTPDEVQTALKIRQEKLIELKKDNEVFELRIDNAEDKISINSSDILRHWLSTFCDKAGKVKTPKYGIVFGFRRFSALPLAIAASAKTVQIDLSSIPCEVITGDRMTRQIACVRENGQKNAGTRSLSAFDKLSASNKLYEGGCLESTLGKIFKRGTSQKLFGICKLNAKYPSLAIVEGILTEKYSMSKFDKEDVRKFNMSEQSIAIIQDWLSKPKTGNTAKVAKGKDIKALAEQSPVLAISAITSAIANNKIDSLASLLDKKEALNTAWTAIMAGERLFTQKEVDQAIKEYKDKKSKKK